VLAPTARPQVRPPRSQHDQGWSYRCFRSCATASRCRCHPLRSRCSPLLPSAHIGKCGALSPNKFSALFTTWPLKPLPFHLTSPEPRSSVNQRCDVGLCFEKSMIDRAELDCTISPKHIFSCNSFFVGRCIFLSSALPACPGYFCYLPNVAVETLGPSWSSIPELSRSLTL
jgi:hypothetical protein